MRLSYVRRSIVLIFLTLGLFSAGAHSATAHLTRAFLAKNLGSSNALLYPAHVSKEMVKLRPLFEDIFDPRKELDLRSEFVLQSDIDFRHIFQGERPTMGTIALRHGNSIILSFPATMMISPDAIPNVRLVTELEKLSMIGPENCDPNIPSGYENLWSLDFTGLNEDQKQSKIKEEFEREFRQWYNNPVAIAANARMVEDLTPAGWFNSFFWRAQQMILIQKTLKPENRFMPLDEFSRIMVEAMGEGSKLMQQASSGEIKINSVPELFSAAGRQKLNPIFLNSSPENKWNMQMDGLVAVRNYLSRYRVRLTDIHALYRRKTDSQTLWTDFLFLEGLTNAYLRHEDPKDPKFYEKETARVLTVLYQIDSELHRRDPQTYKKPTRPKK